MIKFKVSLPVLTLAFLGYYCESTFAFIINYPPYESNNGLFKKIEVGTLIDSNKDVFRSKDNQILVSLTNTGEDFEFIVREGHTNLVQKKSEDSPIPFSVYRVDLDGNGLKDFLIFYNYDQWLYGVQEDKVEIILKKADNSYRTISYDTITASLGDFVDLDKDGEYEIIITGIYNGEKQNYITYNVYTFKDLNLVNVDSKYDDTLLSVWYEYSINDGDKIEGDFTKKEKLLHAEQKNSSIQYQTILDGKIVSSSDLSLKGSETEKVRDEPQKTSAVLIESKKLLENLEVKNKELSNKLIIKEKTLKALEEKNQVLKSIIEAHIKVDKDGQTHPVSMFNESMTFKIGVVDVQRVLDESKKGIEARNYIEGLYSLRSNEELIRTEQVLIEEIIKDIEYIVREYAENGGYTYITEKTEGGVVFNEDQFDVTQAIINLYDKKIAD